MACTAFGLVVLLTCHLGGSWAQAGQGHIGVRNLQDTCPSGTTAAYNDEALAFRFHPDRITTETNDGSVRWNAETPSGMAFTMTRPMERDQVPSDRKDLT